MNDLKPQYEFLIQGYGGGGEAATTRYPIEETEGVSTTGFIRTYDSNGVVTNPGAVSLTQIEVLDLLGEGEIDGLVTGEYDYSFGSVGQVGYDSVPFTAYPVVAGVRWLRSLYWNEVPVVNSNGQANFPDISVNVTNGLPNGSSTSRIKPDLTVSRTIGERLRFGSDFAKTYRVLNTNCKSVEVNIKISALSMTVVGREFEGNATLTYGYPNEIPKTSVDEQGDTEAIAVHYSLSIRPVFSQGVQQNFKVVKIQELFGKISYGYIQKTLVSLTSNNELSENPDFIGWEIKIERITPDSISASVRNATYIDSLTEIYGDVYTYPNSAIVAQKFSAESFSQIPKRAFDVKMLKVKIPSNYNPISKQYSPEPWDGTFDENKQWTDNPAWCFYDLVTNNRYGLGKYISESLVDKWTLYEIGKYCDTLVDDGYGKFEPRFSCNLLLTSREEAYKVLNDMVSIFRGILYYGMGSVYTVQDSQKDQIFQFTNANVENGDFIYSSSSKRVRHTVALVRYNDRHNNFQPAIEYIEDIDGIRRYGIRELEVTAFGCTSRGQALRVGRWALLTETLETEMVSFTAGIEGSYIKPGDVFRISDVGRNGRRYGGRTKLITNTATDSTIRLDDNITGLVNTNTYTLSLSTPTFNYDTSLVSGDLTSDDFSNIRRSQFQQKNFLGSVASGVTGEDSGVYTQITITPGFSTGAYLFSGNPVWTMELSGVADIDNTYFETYRAIKIEEKEGYKFAINGLQYDEDKYNAIDSGLAFEDPVFGQRPPAPKNLLLNIQNPTVNTKLIRYSFVPTASPLTSSFYVYGKTGDFAAADISGSNFLVSVLPNTIHSGLYLPAITGDYFFRVYASNRYGQKSTSFASNHIVINNINPIRDVTINSLMVSTGVGTNLAGDKTTQIVESASPTFKWQAGLNVLSEDFETNFKYKLTIRQSSNNSTPSSNIYHTETGTVNEEFTFDMDTNAASSSNNGTPGPFRTYDVVVEALDDDGNSSAGTNYSNSNGYDILKVTNPRIQINLTTGACLVSDTYCTEQWFTQDGDVRILFTKFTEIDDSAGGYLYWSYAPFTKDQALGRIPAASTITTKEFTSIVNPLVINANITGADVAYIAVAPYDTFDEFLIDDGVNVKSKLFTSNTVRIEKRGSTSDNVIFHAWVELSVSASSYPNNSINDPVTMGTISNAWRNTSAGVTDIISAAISYIGRFNYPFAVQPTTNTKTVYTQYHDIYFETTLANTNYGVTINAFKNYPQTHLEGIDILGGVLTKTTEDALREYRNARFFPGSATIPAQSKLSIQKFTNRIRVYGLDGEAEGVNYFIGILKGAA